MVKARSGGEVTEIGLYISKHKLSLSSSVIIKLFARAKLFGKHLVCKLGLFWV